MELGQQLQIDCLIEAHPKANSYWSKRAREGASSRQQATSDWHRLVEPSLAQRGATSPARKQPIDQLASGHPHSRPHVRHLQDGDTASVSSRATKLELPTEGKAYVTVKQTALNAYTYNLRLTIARVQVEDLGEYSCVASNSMGTSESHVFVASKYSSLTPDCLPLLPIVLTSYLTLPDRSRQAERCSVARGSASPLQPTPGRRRAN